MSGSRQTVLDKVRAATRTGSVAYPEVARNYIHRGSLDPASCVRLMADRLREYDAVVVECSPPDLPKMIADHLQSNGRNDVLVPPGLPTDWLVPGIDWKPDHDLSYDEIERCGGVLTAASAGIADSGTVVLHHSSAEGRRVISLLPDFHLCILHASKIVETLPEYFARFPEPPRLATYISGPSATADIEMTRIKGVHGPRFLTVILVRAEI